jgi:hypothetical protein
MLVDSSDPLRPACDPPTRQVRGGPGSQFARFRTDLEEFSPGSSRFYCARVHLSTAAIHAWRPPSL